MHLGSLSKVRLRMVYDIEKRALACELHDTFIKRTRKTEIVQALVEKSWDAILDNIQLVSNYNKGAKLFLRVIDIYCKYAWMVALKHKGDETIVKTLKLSRHQKEIKVHRVNRLENLKYCDLTKILNSLIDQ